MMRTTIASPRWFVRLAGLVVAAALVAVGCGDDDTAQTVGPADDTTTTSTSAPDASDTTTADGNGAAAVAVGDTSLGPVLVDGDGMTLYLFTPDGGGAPTCEGSCAELWPPLVADAEPTAGEGIDASLLGTAERPDGSTQVTYAGHPLYRYAQDSEPGDVTGQGVNDVWFAVSPDGTAIEEGPAVSDQPGY